MREQRMLTLDHWKAQKLRYLHEELKRALALRYRITMARLLAKSPFVLLALGLWILACPISLAEDNDPNALNQQVSQLIEQGKYQEAIPIAERAVEMAKRVRGPENPETADALNNLGFLFKKIRDYGKAEPLYREALQIRQKVWALNIPTRQRASIT